MPSSAVWDVSSNWEDDAAPPWYDTDNEEVEEGVCSSPEEAGDMFVEKLLKLKYRGTLSAKSVCILAYLAAEAGAVGPAKELGCRPAAEHFQRRIGDFTLFKVESDRSYDVRVPGHDRLENDCVVTEIPFVPPRESIEEELAASAAAADTLATMSREKELLQANFQHPVVRSSAPGTVWPLAIYVDDSVPKAGQYLGDLRGEPRNRFAAPRRNAPEVGHLQVRVQRMVLNFLRHGVRQVELFGNDVRYVANSPP